MSTVYNALANGKPGLPSGWNWVRGMRDGYFRLVDSAIPESIQQGDADRFRQSRTIVGFTLILILLGLESVAYFHYALPLEAATRIDIAFGVSLGLTLAIPWVLRSGHSIALAANLVIAASFLVIVTTFTVFGGIESPLLHWCALPPMLALLMGARRSAWIWAGFGLLTFCALAGAAASGTEFADYFGHTRLSGSHLWIQRGVDTASWLTILMTVAFLYERHNDEQTNRLESKNAELTHEIGQRERAEERTRYLAYYDELTTLPNRQLFKEQLAQAMAKSDRSGGQLGLFFLDLDGFKEVNDSYGHDAGDVLLQQVARRLMHCVRAVDTIGRGIETDGAGEHEDAAEAEPSSVPEKEAVSRLGGDEFTILLDELEDFNQAALVARRVLDSLASAIDIGEHEAFITASIGIAIYRGGPDTIDELLRNADLAMYHAKQAGRNNFQFFEPSMNEAVIERSTLAHDLRSAIPNDELVLEYQPILAARTSKVVGVEALIRWQHPTRGRITPDQFIGIAEETGLIVRIGEWVLTEACRRFASWQDRGVAPDRISVNVSGNQFRGRRLTQAVVEALEASKLEPHQLELEITENAMMIDEEEASRTLQDLAEMGVRIALDDFGTGYSSLSYLKRFPVDVLKIDRSFVGEIECDSGAQAIALAIIAMAHQMSLKVVAEGVETPPQGAFLRNHGCDELQGYLFSKPLHPDDALAFFTRHSDA
jgi:predicted signal transduction protein with EAL and GGDEF domain